MAAMELDPLFVKGLGFLRSKNKESAEQLRELLDDVIAGSGKSKVEKPSSFSGIKGSKDRGLLKDKRGQSSPLRKTTEETRRETEKRSVDRAKFDTSDSDVAPPKKSKVERPQRQAAKPVIEDDDDTEDDSDDSDHDSGKEDTAEANTGGSTDADDFALELGLACIVCKKMDVSAGNQLIECQECHNLYHQQCHKPAATDADPNDPRLVWYCARCARNMKRLASKKPKSLPTSGRDSKGFEITEESPMNLFKRSEPKSVSPSGTTSKQPFTGLASMAANLSGRPPSSSSKSGKPGAMPAGISQRSSSRSSVTSPVSKTMSSVSKQFSSASSSSKMSGSSSKGGNSGKSGPQTSTVSAMKRLQMMKKKASKR